MVYPIFTIINAVIDSLTIELCIDTDSLDSCSFEKKIVNGENLRQEKFCGCHVGNVSVHGESVVGSGRADTKNGQEA